MAPNAPSAFCAWQIRPVEFPRVSSQFSAFSSDAREACRLKFRQRPRVLKVCGLFGFGFGLAKDRGFPVFEFQSECRGEGLANNAVVQWSVHWSLLAASLRYRRYDLLVQTGPWTF